MARPKPPLYAQLIATARLAPPKMTVTRAAELTRTADRKAISDTRWSQLENGYRMNRGHAEAEWAPADTLALMARAVGVTPEQLEEADRGDAAAELRVLPALKDAAAADTDALARRIEEVGAALMGRMDRNEELLERLLREREHDDKEDDTNGQANGSRRAG